MTFFIFSMLLWIIAIFLLISEPKNEIVWWESAVLFLAGCGGVASLLEDSVSRVIIDGIISDNLPNNNMILHLSGFFNSLSHYWAPYAFLILNLNLSNLFLNRWKNLKSVLYFVFMIPPILMYIFFPNYPGFSQYQPGESLNRVMVVWVTAYTIGSYLFLFYSYIKAESPKQKRDKLLICILFVPTTVVVLITNYICVVLKIRNLWMAWNIWIIIIQFILCVLFTVKYGVLVSVERNRVDKAIKVMTSGTGILNHTIKNEVTKISICADNIRFTLNGDNQKLSKDIINQNLDIIMKSTQHMVSMVKRINEHMQDIMLVEEQVNLSDIIDSSLDDIKTYTGSKRINVVNTVNTDLYVICDKIHIKEVINNIIKNAVEAMGNEGKLKIYSYKSKKNITVAIKDNGSGISKENLQHVMDPFFSTKNRKMNFGLGLSYCYNVMRKHGGSMEIESRENAGTTVYLYFPPGKIINGTVNLSSTSKV